MTADAGWRAEQLERYSRQILVPGIGGRGQQRLLRSCVVVNGANHLAEAFASALLRAGVGRLLGPSALVRRIASEASADNELRVLETFVDSPASFESLPAAPDLVVDTELSFSAWCTLARAPGDAHVPLLFVRTAASVAVVALWQGGRQDAACPGWFFDFLPRVSRPHASFAALAARHWSAWWASALALRVLVHPHSPRYPTPLLLYDVASGEVTEIPSPRGHHCEFCTRG